MKNNRKLALCGILGGLLMTAANIAVHVGSAMTGANPDPGWLSMPSIMCGISELLAVVGAAGLFAGWLSLYRMTSDTCGKRMRVLAGVPVIGAAGMALFHGNINCVEPIIYQVLSKGGGEDMYPAMDAAVSGSFAPVDLLILIAFYLQVIVLFYTVLSGKAGVKKGLVLLNPVTGLIIGAALGAVLPANLSGIALGMRNLGEALMYIVPFVYWRKKR